MSQSLSLLSAVPPPQPTLLMSPSDNQDVNLLIEKAVNNACLSSDGKRQLVFHWTEQCQRTIQDMCDFNSCPWSFKTCMT